MENNYVCLITVSLLILIGLVGCAAETQTEPTLAPVPSSTPVPKPSSTVTTAPTNTPAPSATPVPTEVPPTETAIPPTEVPPTNTATVEPTVALTENITNQQEDIVGTWIGESEGDVFRLFFEEDGDAKLLDQYGATYGAGDYYFEGDQLIIESNFCQIWDAGYLVEKPCSATYTVYVAKDGDSVVGLRFESIQDKYDLRRWAMKQAKWQRAEE